MEIHIELKGARELMDSLSRKPSQIARAASSAINRAAKHCRAQIVKLAREQYTMKAGTVRDAIKVSRSTPATMRAELDITRKSIGLIEYRTKGGTSGTRTTSTLRRQRRRTVRPVQVMVKKTGGYKVLPQAFKATMRYGPKVFVREGGAARFPVQALAGPSMGGIVTANIERIKASTDKNLSDSFRWLIDNAFKGKAIANE